VKKQGTTVLHGPLAGMDFLRESAEGCHVAKLLGSYEQPLQPFIEAAIQAQYPLILNIGCAEGYYAVGMARRMPATRVLAFDLDLNAQQVCAELIAKNKVTDRVTVGALFKPADFAQHMGQKVLVLCDIEGAERELLDPVNAPALLGMDVIVESHECLIPGFTELLINGYRFITLTIHSINIGVNVIRVPSLFSNSSFTRFLQYTMLVTSASVKLVTCGLVCTLFTMCLAISLRIRSISTNSVTPDTTTFEGSDHLPESVGTVSSGSDILGGGAVSIGMV
jgi:hypothetical protein